MRKGFSFLWILAGAVILFGWIYLPSLSHYDDLKQDEKKISSQILELETKIKALEEEREKLTGDVQYLEKVIRDEMGLVRPGESVYKIVPTSELKKAKPSITPPPSDTLPLEEFIDTADIQQ